jgi:hypothetical protein
MNCCSDERDTMKIMKRLSFFLICLLLTIGCGDKTNDLKNGVMYAKNALEQVGANPFSRATYESVIGRGGNAAEYIKATLPKEDPPFESYEFGKPSHPWTIVIRQGTEVNEYHIEGYGVDVKKPMLFETVQVILPESQ